MVGCPLAAAVSSCRVEPDRWSHLILQLGRTLTVVGGVVRSLSLFSALLCGLLLGWLLWIRVGVLNRRRC